MPKERKNTLSEIELFSGYYLGHDLKSPVPDFHRELYEIIMRGDTRVVIAAPRSFAKSTVFSKIYPLYQICQGKAKKILIVSNTAEFAESWLRIIKYELENNKYIIEDFGKFEQLKWANDHIIIRNQLDGRVVEAMAKGEQKQVRGYRPDIVVLDDLEDDSSVRSQDQRTKRREWMDKALINTLEKDSQLIMIGTILHPLSLLSNVMTRENWTVRKYQALTPDDKSIWPEKWSYEALMERKKEIGTAAFNSEYMNEPILSENPIFVKDWFNEYDSGSNIFKKETARGLFTCMAVDPAISRKETADYTAVVTVSATFDKQPKIYVRVGGVVRGHWPLNKTVSEMERIYSKFGAKTIIVETVAFQKAVADEFKLFCEDHRIFPRVKEVKPDRDKERRAHTVVPLFERRQVYFDFSDPMTQKLCEELVLFPTGEHDDLTDALVYALDEVGKWTKRRNLRVGNGPNIVLPSKHRSEVTGVV